MRNFGWMMGALLLCFSAATAFCQSGSSKITISDEEYGIFRLVVEKLEGRCSVDKETLDGVRADEAPMNMPGQIQPGSDIIKNFNHKNIHPYTLSEAFVQEMSQSSATGLEGRKKTTLSMIGFDKEKRQALLVMGTTLYTPEDIMNVGRYVFLEKKNGRWTIVTTSTAWNPRMGRIR